MLVQRDTLRMVHLLYNFFSPAVPWEGIKALTCGCGIIQEKCDDLGQEGLWVKRKPMNTILECFPLSGWDLAHFRGRHVTVSVTSRTAVLNNQLEEESAVELMEKCIFLAFIPRFWFPCDTIYAQTQYPIWEKSCLDMCMCINESLFCTAEIIKTFVNQLYFNKRKKLAVATKGTTDIHPPGELHLWIDFLICLCAPLSREYKQIGCGKMLAEERSSGVVVGPPTFRGISSGPDGHHGS